MIKIPIVITTINPPTKAVKTFAKLKNYTLFVAGDNKTPKDWTCNNSEFISIDEQHKKFKIISKLVSQNHYARKNLAYVIAIQSGAEYLYETDDDNFPNKAFPNFLRKQTVIEEIEAQMSFNIYSQFTKKNVWPRGIPLNHIQNPIKRTKKTKVEPLIQQSLADLDPDVDAIYRLTNGQVIHFDKNKSFALAPNTYCPFNSQNTYWNKKVFPLLYLPSTIDSRVTDIWRGYIAQRVLWELDSRLIFLSPSVYQERNIHNFMRDFEQELDLYLKTEKLIMALDEVKLKGTVKTMLRKVYEHLITGGFFKKEELKILDEWFKII